MQGGLSEWVDRLQAKRVVAVFDLGIEAPQKIQAEHTIDAAFFGKIAADDCEILKALVYCLDLIDNQCFHRFRYNEWPCLRLGFLA